MFVEIHKLLRVMEFSQPRSPELSLVMVGNDKYRFQGGYKAEWDLPLAKGDKFITGRLKAARNDGFFVVVPIKLSVLRLQQHADSLFLEVQTAYARGVRRLESYLDPKCDCGYGVLDDCPIHGKLQTVST